jgi:hypothetical protein
VLPKGLKAKTLINCLEETEIFRTYSYLLKTLNCSVYEMVQKSGNFELIVQEIKRKEEALRDKLNEGGESGGRATDWEVAESALEDFFKFLRSTNVISMEMVGAVGTCDGNRDRPQAKQGGEQTGRKPESRTFKCRIMVYEKKIREFNEKVLFELTEGETATVSPPDN